MDYNTTVSWVLYSIREIVGISSLRNQILESFLNQDIKKNIEFGRTFGSDSKKNDLQNYLEKNMKQNKNGKRFLIFSGINRPKYGETHYQGFIIDYEKKCLYIADPAYTLNGPGIYNPFLAQQQVIPLFKLHNYNTQFIITSHPCQTSTNDVFCQSWTLYLMIEFLNPIGNIITIPLSQTKRYNILLHFYKKISVQIPEFCLLFI